MEGFKPPRAESQESEEKEEGEIYERVTEHSVEFDKETKRTAEYLPEQVEAAWTTREWTVGDSKVKALGVEHVPETFLQYREQIEDAIADCDIVVNEFAPEALGFYDESLAPHLREIKSRYNEHYDLEQLREAYLKSERAWNIGLFHHEVELLAAKFDKDMALVDLTTTMDVEKALQSVYLYAAGAEKFGEERAKTEGDLLRAGSVAAGAAAAASLLGDTGKTMTRRQFLKAGAMAGAAAVAASAPEFTKAPPRLAEERSGKNPDERALEQLRNPHIATSLKMLADAGFKKIAVIYGSHHIPEVEHYLQHPEEAKQQLDDAAEVIEQANPDAFRIYRLGEGENHSERFVAARDRVWQRVA